jgi:hypothetical protein
MEPVNVFTALAPRAYQVYHLKASHTGDRIFSLLENIALPSKTYQEQTFRD